MGKGKKNIIRRNAKYFTSCKGVFQGGGLKGISFIGAYEQAIASGISFTEVSGTSAGAIMAAFIAAGATPDEMREFLDNLLIAARKKIKSNWFFRIKILPFLIIYKFSVWFKTSIFLHIYLY